MKKEREEIDKILSYLIENSDSEIKLSHLYSISDQQNVNTTLSFLNLFGICIIQNDSIEVLGDKALGFLKSIKIYLYNRFQIFSNWQSSYIGQEGITENDFLYHLETRRHKKYKSLQTIDEINITLIIIKADIGHENTPKYLVQFNSKTNRFQFLGGIVEDNTQVDKNIENLLKKELPLTTLKKYTQHSIADSIYLINVSQKTGQLTSYFINLIHVDNIDKDLKLQGIDRWVNIDEMYAGFTDDGISIQTPFEDLVNKDDFKKLLNETKLSLSTIQPIHKCMVSSNYKIEKEKLFNSKEILKLIKSEESNKLEFKSSVRWDYKKNEINKGLEMIILKTMCGFLNSEGGTLIIGVSDDKEVLGITNDINSLQRKDEDGFIQFLTNLFVEYIGSEYSSFISIQFQFIDDKAISIIEVKSSPTPVFLKLKQNREFFIRYGNTTRLLNSEESYKYISSRNT